MSAPLKCFVAMAFSRADTDRLYDEGICPALHERGVAVVRVDRLNHNDNIDDRILREIQEADFMIADLTYARPSVYYEAGFAERAIPVIFTVRRDHFVVRNDDEFGNLRVHFDLSMRNIIDWDSPDDPAFLARLASRIELILQPILASRGADEERAHEIDAFQSLSARDREDRLNSLARREFQRLGYLDHEAVKKAGQSGSFIYERDEWYLPEMQYYRFVRLKCPTGEQIFLPDRDRPEYNLNVGCGLANVMAIDEHWILGSFGHLDREKIREQLKAFSKTGDKTFCQVVETAIPVLNHGFRGDVFLDWQYVTSGLFQGDYQNGFRTKLPPPGSLHVRAKVHREFRFVYGGFETRSVQRARYVHIIDGIRSAEDFQRRLLDIIEADERAFPTE